MAVTNGFILQQTQSISSAGFPVPVKVTIPAAPGQREILIRPDSNNTQVVKIGASDVRFVAGDDNEGLTLDHANNDAVLGEIAGNRQLSFYIALASGAPNQIIHVYTK